jgi:hypothetical protein
MINSNYDCLNPVMQQILVAHTYSPFYQECERQLNLCRHALNQTQYRYALEVIGGVAWLENNSEVISDIGNENQRNSYITQATSLVAETGLIQGNSKDEIRQSLLKRVEEFREAYLFDHLRQKLDHFFAEAFLGPPCFNGRLITLKEYIEREQGRIGTYPFKRHTDYDKEAIELEDFIYEWMEQNDSQIIPSSTTLQQSMGPHPLAQHPRFSEIYIRASEFTSLTGQ